MKNEKYQPNEEELKQTELMMTETQKKMSIERERMFSSMEEKGLKGILVGENFSPDYGNDQKRTLSGTINNHDIKIVYSPVLSGRDGDEGYTGKTKFDYTGSIDGKPLQEKDAERILGLVGDDFINAEKQDENTEKIREELEEVKVEKLVDDIFQQAEKNKK